MIRKALLGLVCLLVILGGVVFEGERTVASSTFDWLDSEQDPRVLESYRLSSEEASSVQDDGCMVESVRIKEDQNSPEMLADLCVRHTGNVSIGYDNNQRKHFLSKDGDLYRRVLISSRDRVFIDNASGRVVYVLPGIHTMGQSLLIYDNYIEGLFYDEAIGSYDLPRVKHPYSTDSERGGLGVMAYALSSNGKFLVYSIGGSYAHPDKVYRINLDTREVFYVGQSGTAYMYSPQPVPQYAISDDGNTIVEGGYYAKIWRADKDSCRDDNSWSVDYGYDSCKSKGYGWEKFDVDEPSPSAYPYMYDLGLRDNGARLRFKFDARADIFQVDIAAPGYTILDTPRLEYLALGDSYSSGEGDIEKRSDGSSYYLDGTEKDGRCHLSSRSYPFLLRSLWSLDNDSMKSVACSGAKLLPDIYGNMADYPGQHDEISKSANWAGTQNGALDDFKPGVVPQIEFVKKYQPKIVTFTAGGNDVGFGDILQYCASPVFDSAKSRCAYAKDVQIRANLNMQIDSQYAPIKGFVESIQAASPLTKVYIIGYPQFITTKGLTCSTDSYMLDPYERQMIVESVYRLNNTLKKVARDTGVYYIDIEDSLAGGRICEGSGYMTGPLKVVVANLSTKKDSNMFHPNSAGHQKMANRIESRIDRYQDYVIIDIPEETGGVRVVRRDLIPASIEANQDYTVEMPPGWIKPDGTVTIEMFSKRIDLGTGKTGPDGSFSAKIRLPIDTLEGIHLLTLNGLDPDGEPVQIQQFIFVENSSIQSNRDDNKDDTETRKLTENNLVEDAPNTELATDKRGFLPRINSPALEIEALMLEDGERGVARSSQSRDTLADTTDSKVGENAPRIPIYAILIILAGGVAWYVIKITKK